MTNLPTGPQGLRATLSFEALWKRGWKTLIPVIPPYVTLSPNTKLPDDVRGKAPGVAYSTGWGGFPEWQNIKPTLELYRAWEKMGASIGCRCDEMLGLDCDIPDQELSLAVLKALREDPATGLGHAAVRVGSTPKWLMPCAIPGGTANWNLDFKRDDIAQSTFQFQGLGRGKQFVAWGIHSGTGLLYRWPPAQTVPVFNTLPVVTDENIAAIKARIVATLESLGCTLVKASSGTAADATVDQAGLKGPQELVHEALQAIPNDLTYDDWQNMAVALRGASQDWPAEGIDLFLEFTARCTRVAPDPSDALRKYASYRSPFRLGAQYIYDVAGKRGWNKAAADFTPMANAVALVEQQKEREHTVEWGSHVHPVLAQSTSEQSKYSDQALSHRFISTYQDRIIYVGEQGLWHGWDGQRWRPDTTKAIDSVVLSDFLIKEATRVKVQAAETKAEQKERDALVRRLMSAAQHKNVAGLVRPPLTISHENLDVDTWALNTPAGLVDLRTGDMVTMNRRRYVTRLTRVGPAERGAVPTRWLRFMDEVTQGDDEMVAWLQRALGYTLSGELTDHTVFFLYGSGGNGKSVLLDTIFALLGTYATVADRGVFLKTRFQEHATVRASLAGARLIIVPEIPAGAEWNDALLKEFSAGNGIKARFIGRNEFTYTPQGTLWFSGNDRPTLSKIDPAIERRFRLITFDFSPEKPDPHLRSHLVEKEGPAILRWLLDGFLAWQSEGLGKAKAVERGTQDYFAENDPVRSWARDCCSLGVGERDGSSELFESYTKWWKDNLASGAAGDMLTQRAFVQRLRSLPGVGQLRSSDRRWMTGISRRVRTVPAGMPTAAEILS